MKKIPIEHYLIKYDITKEYLEDAYVNRQLSLPDIKREKGIDFKCCSKLLSHFGIKVRTISEARTTPIGKKKILESTKLKYGVENISQSEVIKNKKKETFIKNYGVDNIRKYPPFYEWLSNHCIEKYGTSRIGSCNWPKDKRVEQAKLQWITMSSEKKEKILSTIFNNITHGSSKENKLETKIESLLDKLEVPYNRFFRVGKYICDFYLPDTNLVLEINGDFWHANPSTYKETDLIKFPNTNGILAKNIWDKDLKRLKFISEKLQGCKICILWETEIKKSSELELLQILRNKIQESK